MLHIPIVHADDVSKQMPRELSPFCIQRREKSSAKHLTTDGNKGTSWWRSSSHFFFGIGVFNYRKKPKEKEKREHIPIVHADDVSKQMPRELSPFCIQRREKSSAKRLTTDGNKGTSWWRSSSHFFFGIGVFNYRKKPKEKEKREQGPLHRVSQNY